MHPPLCQEQLSKRSAQTGQSCAWADSSAKAEALFEGKSLCVESYQHRKSSSCAKSVVLWRFLVPFVVSATILLVRDLQTVLKNLFCGGASVCRSRMGS